MSQDTAENTERSCYADVVENKDLTACQAMAAIFKEYTRERPEVVALWAFGVGFVLGWKLKLW